MLFTHFHWDHIQGFPFFTPAFIKDNVFNIYSERKINANIHTVLEGQMMYPNFPVTLDELESTIIYHEIAVGNTFPLTEDIHITTAPLNHPGGAVSFRIEYKGRRLVTAWDTEHYTEINHDLLKQAEGADLLIYDSTYTDDEYHGRTGNSAKIGWGHSTWQEAIKLAKAAGVKKLILTHHDPTHTDDFMDKINDAVREHFPDSQVAFEGLLLDL
jgi:phosphoribosyl 1,2-cyclic phosphodiesterase